MTLNASSFNLLSFQGIKNTGHHGLSPLKKPISKRPQFHPKNDTEKKYLYENLNSALIKCQQKYYLVLYDVKQYLEPLYTENALKN